MVVVTEMTVEMIRCMESWIYSEEGAIGAGETGFWYKTKREVMMMPRFLTVGFVSCKWNASQELLGTTMWRKHAPR